MEPLRVLVTGAAGQIAYSLLYSVAKGDVFGVDQPISLVLLDIKVMMGVLNGVVMELRDCALPLLKDITATSDYDVAFAAIDVAILVGAMPRREGMERKDLLSANVKIFEEQGKALDAYAKKTVKVVVVGNPANTNACICSRNAPSIPKENFTCLTRLDQNRASSQIAVRLDISPRDVRNVIIWGNHSSTQFPDVSHASALSGDGDKWLPVTDLVKDDAWLNNEFIQTVQTRGASVIAARKLSSAMSAAKAICDHLRDWWNGIEEVSNFIVSR
jgi:malate dehydrogenase